MDIKYFMMCLVYSKTIQGMNYNKIHGWVNMWLKLNIALILLFKL